MADWGFELSGDRQAELRFEQFPQFARERLLRALANIDARLLAAVKAGEPVRTGRLQGETAGRVAAQGDRLSAIVAVKAGSGPERGKAAALEYGAAHPFEVRAHAAMLAHLWSRAIAPIEVEIAAHSRRPNIAARKYLRGPLDAMRGQALDEMRRAIAIQ